MSVAFLRALGEIYPGPRLLRQTAQLLPYESDALTAYHARPLAVVLPESAAEVVATVRACHQHSVPFVARGSGTSLSGGSMPIEGGIVIGLNRLNRILELDPAERIAVVEPGVVNLKVTEAAAPYGLYYAPDPSSQSVCTIGGNVAFNSGGAHCLRYGMTSNHVLGLRVVLADGTMTMLGGRSLEGVGPDVAGLFVGSEGLFGVALEITLRLLPRPESWFTLLAAYDSLEAAGNAVALVIASGLLPAAMEIMDRLAIKAAEAAVHAGYPERAAALLIVELEGESLEVAAEAEVLREVIARSGPSEARIARDAAERERIWKGRKGAFSAVGRLSPDYVVQDGVVPRARLGEALAEVERLSREHGLECANVFHAGDGNLHPLILYDGKRPGALERAETLAGEILRMCVRLGGSITGEHGVGLEKRAYLPEMYGADDIDAMRRLRQAFDPRRIANPGKMLVDETDSGAPVHLAHGQHPLERAGVIQRE
jgi:glycolate dehydrogenase FAD-linked subunit